MIVATTRFEGLRAFLRTRRAIIATDHGLRERELERYAVLSAVVAREFAHRGLDQHQDPTNPEHINERRIQRSLGNHRRRSMTNHGSGLVERQILSNVKS